MAAAPALQTANEILTPPTDEETLSLFNPIEGEQAYEINEHILNHPLTLQLQADERFYPSRPHLKIPPSLRTHNFTGGTLSGEDKIPVPPLIFATRDGSELVSIQYLGVALCGHPGIIHGGLLATLLDEGLARCCFPALPNKVGVTASLKIDYRKPCMAGQYVVMKAETTKVEGRKAWVTGRLETLPAEGEGEVLVEAEALFIEPRQAKVGRNH
jgi:acyl-coenzyme A thioesterase PaaI-like protein